MINAVEHSTLNRLVAGSIPAASTIYLLKTNNLRSTMCARKEAQRFPIVVFVVLYRSTLVIVWSYTKSICLGISQPAFTLGLMEITSQYRDETAYICVDMNKVSMLPLPSHHMKVLGNQSDSRYLRLAYLRMEKKHETYCRRHSWSSYGHCHHRRSCQHPPDSDQRQPGSTLPTRCAGLRPQPLAVMAGVTL
jgi:hypothetical protein